LSYEPPPVSPGYGALRAGGRTHAIFSPPVYYWFTEGFDTPDLKDAKACRGCSWRIWASIWSMRHNRA